jgi:hypothetical protein
VIVLRTWRIGCTVGALCALAATGVAVGQDDPVRRALLIGINNYESPLVPDLRGAVNDVTMIDRILTTRFGFEPRNVTILTDENATRDAVLGALADLARAAGPDDLVYVHYSGHGSQVEDTSGDEEDGLDETFLPQNARLDGIPDITDDELERLLAQIRSTNTLIVFDSCNSGTITRAASSVRPRAVPPDTRVELYPATRAVVEVRQLPHILMTGAPAEQQALDGPVNDGWYGLFSFALAQSLDRLGPGASALQIHDLVLTELREIQEQLFTTAPEPQLEAPPSKLMQPLFPIARSDSDSSVTATEARRAWLAVQTIDADYVKLLDGLTLNAQPGSQWGVYGPDETEFRYGNAIAVGIVESIDGNDAFLSIRYRNATIPSNARAIRLAATSVAESIPVRIDALEDERRRRRRLEEEIRDRLPVVQFVEGTDFARFIVTLEGESWHVLDAGGLSTALVIPQGDDAETAEQLARVFSSSTNAASLLALENPLAEFDVRVRVVDASASNTSRGLAVGPKSLPRGRIRRPNEPRTFDNSLMLEIESDRDAYLTIVDIDTEGGINLLFPNDYQNPDFLPDGFVSAGAVTRIPDSLGEPNRARFHWDYGLPPGKDTIQVIVATDPGMASTIREFVERIANEQGTIESLRSALASAAVRGVTVVPNAPPSAVGEAPPAPISAQVAIAQDEVAGPEGRTDWATGSVVVEIRE